VGKTTKKPALAGFFVVFGTFVEGTGGMSNFFEADLRLFERMCG
jgi:hypothetical protein